MKETWNSAEHLTRYETMMAEWKRSECRATILILWLVRLFSLLLSHYNNLNNFFQALRQQTAAVNLITPQKNFSYRGELSLALPDAQRTIPKVFQFEANFERWKLSEWVKFRACELILHFECKWFLCVYFYTSVSLPPMTMQYRASLYLKVGSSLVLLTLPPPIRRRKLLPSPRLYN